MELQNATVLDVSSIIAKISNVREARGLPAGTVVGDRCGGLTFSDAIAAALEARSSGGWQETPGPQGEIWTVIVLNR